MSELISNILVGVDFSEGASRALRYATQLAMQSGAHLHVLHVHGNAAALIPDPFAVGLTAEVYLQRLREDLEQRRVDLAQLVEREVAVPSAGKVRVSQLLREGEARHTVLAAVEEFKADLLIVGSHGRGAVMRMLLGSVSSFLCHHSPVPLLVVPTPGRGS